MIRRWSLCQYVSCLNWNNRPGAKKKSENERVVPVLKVERHLLEFSSDENIYLHLCKSICSLRTVKWAKCVHTIIQKNLLDEWKELSTDEFYIDGLLYIYLNNIPRQSCFFNCTVCKKLVFRIGRLNTCAYIDICTFTFIQHASTFTL